MLQENALAMLHARVMVVGLSLSLAGCSGSYRASINRVLKQDETVSQQLSQEAGILDLAWNQADLVGRKVKSMRSIDLDSCPTEFQTAYREHIQAWAEYESAARRHQGFRGVIKGVLTGGISLIDGYSDLSDAHNKAKSTFEEVIRVAKKYGAEPPGEP